jgi:pimeloyl-ACP methyl ester carboxylesterase
MAPEIGILVIHGIGIQDKNFANGLIDKVNGSLKNNGVTPGAVAWEPAFWADLLTKNEEELWKGLSAQHNLSWVKVRQFVINVLADALAYQRNPEEDQDMYKRIHARIREHLAHLRTSLGDQDNPLIVIAHSLGSVIASNYTWDAQTWNKYSLGDNPFERMETLASLVTFGSNIPLFTLALPDPKAIEFPPAQLPENLKAAAKWLNFFDPDDVLGYPLKPLSPSYGKAVNEDIEVNAGSWITSWNPISHTEYWTNGDFTKRVAALISDVVAAGRTV